MQQELISTPKAYVNDAFLLQVLYGKHALCGKNAKLLLLNLVVQH
jgi:hypothetical protein